MPIEETKTHDCAAWLMEGAGCAECNVTAGAIRQYWDDPVRKERDQLRAEVERLRDALAPFAAMHREGSDPKEMACKRGYASDATYLFSEDFSNAYDALRDLTEAQATNAD
jgi:hypothetical protein